MSHSAPSPDTGDELIDALLMAAHRVRTATDARLRQEGLSLARLKVLRLLADEPRSMGHLSAALEVVPRSTTDLVDGMVAAGLIERSAHPTDRRVVLLGLTAEGRARLASSRQRATEVASWATRCVPAGRRGALVALLEQIGDPERPESAAPHDGPEGTAPAPPGPEAGRPRRNGRRRVR